MKPPEYSPFRPGHIEHFGTDNVPGDLFTLPGYSEIIRFCRMNTTETSLEANQRRQRAEAHFEKLIEFRLPVLERGGLLAFGPRPDEGLGTKGMYLAVPKADGLSDLSSSDLSRVDLENHLVKPLVGYYAWALGTQDEVLKDLIIEVPEGWLDQFSIFSDNQIVLHDTDPSMIDLREPEGLEGFGSIIAFLEQQCRRTIGQDTATLEKLNALHEDIQAKLAAKRALKR